MYAEAKREGSTYKYVASAEFKNRKSKISVGLKKVPLISKIGALQWTSNIFVMHSDIYNITPHVIDSPWAWLELTANSLRNSIVKLLPRNPSR